MKPDQWRKLLVGAVTLGICGCVLALARLRVFPATVGLLDHHWLSLGMGLVEAGLGVYVMQVGARAKRPLIVALALAQTALMAMCPGGASAAFVHGSMRR